MKNHGIHKTCYLPVVTAILLLASSSLLAQVPQDNVLDAIVQKYEAAVGPWRATLTHYANRLFWLLVFIDFAWGGITQIMRRADLSEIISDTMQRVMTIGFYLALVQNSELWTSAIIQSFRKAAADANAGLIGVASGYSPSDIFDAGLAIAVRVTESMSFLAPGDSVAIGVTAIIILILFALIAALMVVTLVEMYIALGASVLFLGFGGSRWTRDIATRQFKHVVAVGAKLFAMQLIVSIGQTIISSWFFSYQHSWSQLLVLLGSAVVYMIIVFSIPPMFQSLVDGAQVGSGGQQIISTTSTLAAAAATGGAQGVGAAMAAKEAFQLAKLQAGGDSSAAQNLLGAMGLLGGSAINSVVGKISGNPMMQGGTMGGRMTADLREQRLSFSSDEAPGTRSANQYEPDVDLEGHASMAPISSMPPMEDAPPAEKAQPTENTSDTRSQEPDRGWDSIFFDSKPSEPAVSDIPQRDSAKEPPARSESKSPEADGGWDSLFLQQASNKTTILMNAGDIEI